ncbi:MAG TPA: dTDP-4-dehydrorhamnose 3,5-epimerase [Bacteroidales bacterium]|nr:dTDP-4-dehydrorhamnose 3,5-epimerase [Bacteroidales bacterium]
MIANEKGIKGIYEIILKPIIDNRGFFMRTFDEELFKQFGIPSNWVQENHSKNLLKNTVRGLHFILPPYTDSKLIRCIRGHVFDVFVDLRKGSSSFGKWESVELKDDDYKWLFLPKGIAHGFCTLEDNTELLYKHDTYYQKEYDRGIVWNDKDLNIEWPVKNPIISEKDSNLMSYQKFLKDVGGL